MSKTPDYTKKAVANYREKFDILQLRLPKGTKEKLKNKGNINEYICALILKDLEKSN